MESRSLRNDEIYDTLCQYDSEDGLDDDDDDSVIDPEYQSFLEDLEPFSDCDENSGVDIDSIIEESECCEPIAGPSSPDPAQQIRQSGSTNQKRQKRQLKWKKKNLVINDHQIRCIGNTTLPPNLLELDTPIQFFFLLFPQRTYKFYY